jgi:hypothetical protein
MSQAELRHWIHQFLYNPAFGWSHCKLAFARFLGIDLHGLKSKIRPGRPGLCFAAGSRSGSAGRLPATYSDARALAVQLGVESYSTRTAGCSQLHTPADTLSYRR